MRSAYAGILLGACIVAWALPVLASEEEITNACDRSGVYGDISGAIDARNKNGKGIVGCKEDAELLGLTCQGIGDPVPYLLDRRSKNNHGNIPPDSDITDMDPKFACELAKFIKKGEEAGAYMKIYSGTRPYHEPTSADLARYGGNQTYMCQRIPCGKSTHELGCAADLSYNGERQVEYGQCRGNAACAWAHANRPNTMQFRLMPESGFTQGPEPWHIEIAGAKGLEAIGGQGYCPDNPGTPSPSGGLPMQSSAAPSTASLASAMRNLFSPPPPPITPPQPMAAAYDPTQYFAPAASPAGGPTSPGTISIADTPAPPPVSKAVSDLIKAISGSDMTPQASSTATGTPIALIDALRNTAGLKPGQAPTSTGTSTVSIASLTPPNTFRSNDLRTSPLTATYYNRSTTFMVLEQLRQTLVRLLAILKPFGGVRTYARMPASSETLE